MTVQLLPFDNQAELQVVLDLPRGASLEATDRVLAAAGRRLAGLPELASIQSYAGTAAPFNFNGLVGHYYLRSSPEQVELPVNRFAKDHRQRTTQALLPRVRPRLEARAVPE